MTTAAEFKRCNNKWSVVKSEWTENGRPVKSGDPKKWNYMRVKLESGEEFLLNAETVKEIGVMKWKGIKFALILSILLTGILAHPRHVQSETEAQLAFNGLYQHMEKVK